MFSVFETVRICLMLALQPSRLSLPLPPCPTAPLPARRPASYHANWISVLP
jgi:hypothetical protein